MPDEKIGKQPPGTTGSASEPAPQREAPPPEAKKIPKVKIDDESMPAEKPM